jgi:hypothetical protein
VLDCAVIYILLITENNGDVSPEITISYMFAPSWAIIKEFPIVE